MVGNEEYDFLHAESDAEDGSSRLPPPVARRLAHRTAIQVTVCYCSIMVLNGGLVGAFGPSLDPLSRQTGASLGVLGGAVMQNRLSKLAGTVLWGWYANRVQTVRSEEELAVQPNVLIAASLLCLAACCATFGFTRSTSVLTIMMNVSGFMYGISDSAANLLITWVWHHDARKQRMYVAILNAMFTVGAFMTPMLIAVSMHSMKGAIWPAYYCLAAGAIVLSLFLPMLPSPPTPPAVAATASSKGNAAVAPADSPLQPATEDADTDADEQARLVSAADASGVLTPPPTGSKAKGRAVPGVAVASSSCTGSLGSGGGGSGGSGAASGVGGGRRGAGAGSGDDEAAALDAAADARYDQGWVYLGDPACEAILPRYVVCMAAICTLCFFANGCEHAVATWLSSFGIQHRRTSRAQHAHQARLPRRCRTARTPDAPAAALSCPCAAPTPAAPRSYRTHLAVSPSCFPCPRVSQIWARRPWQS